MVQPLTSEPRTLNPYMDAMPETGKQSEALLLQLEALGIPGEDAGAHIREIYARSARLELPLIDYLTIRDLLELSGCPAEAPLTAVLILMFAVLEEGSLCLDLEEQALAGRLRGFLGDETARETAASFLAGLSENRYAGLIAADGDAYLPLVLSDRNQGKRLYFQKFHVHETLLRQEMEALLSAGPVVSPLEGEIGPIIEEIYSPDLCIRVGKDGRPIDRDARQEEALRLALKSRFCIVSGGPGTGKTSLMVNMLRSFVRAGCRADQILLGAPTGRAGRRMTEAIQRAINTIRSPAACDRELLALKGSTLHKLLRYRRPDHDFYYRETNPLPASVIILDEVSMVDVVMMERFLRAVDPARTRLILLGDKDQLPSVEAGAVFAEMIPDGTRAERFRDRLVILDTVYRSGDQLIRLGKALKDGRLPECETLPLGAALNLPRDRWAMVQPKGLRQWRHALHAWVDHHYRTGLAGDGRTYADLIQEAGRMDVGSLLDSEAGVSLLGRIFERLQGARILSLVRHGAYGCMGINLEIAHRLAGPAGRQPGPTGGGCYPGAIIMITRNDYARELYNGDVGVVIRDPEGAHRAVFPHLDGYASFSMDRLPPWESAFAQTVHKSQGSEFDDVLLVLPQDETHRLLTREILYTAVTRARRRILIYGTASAVKTALSRRIERRSGLEW